MFSFRRYLPTLVGVFSRNFSVLSKDIQREIKRLLKVKDSVAIAAFLQSHGPTPFIESGKHSKLVNNSSDKDAGLSQGFLCLFAKERTEQFENGLRLLRCIKATHPQAYHNTLLAMISNLTTEKDAACITLCLNELHKANLQLDKANQERIVKLLCRSMNIRLTRDILTRYPITGSMLVDMSEPFIMPGYVRTYAEYLHNYLNDSSNWDYNTVYDILCSTLRARLRRSLTRSPLNSTEKEGIRMISAALEVFQKRHLLTETVEHVDLVEANSFRKCLYVVAFYLELTLSWAGDQPLPIDSDVSVDRFRSQLGQELLPFLLENRTVEDWDGGSSVELPISSQICDLTAEIARRQPLVPMYNAKLFPRSYTVEVTYTATIIGQMQDDFDDLNDMGHFDETGDHDDDDDEDDDSSEFDGDDDEFDDDDIEDYGFEGMDDDDHEIDNDDIFDEYMTKSDARTQLIDDTLDDVTVVDFDFDLDDVPESQHRSIGGFENPRWRIQDFTYGLQQHYHQARLSFVDEFFASRGSIKRQALRASSTRIAIPDLPPAPDNGSGGTVGVDTKSKRSIRDVVDKDP